MVDGNASAWCERALSNKKAKTYATCELSDHRLEVAPTTPAGGEVEHNTHT